MAVCQKDEHLSHVLGFFLALHWTYFLPIISNKGPVKEQRTSSYKIIWIFWFPMVVISYCFNLLNIIFLFFIKTRNIIILRILPFLYCPTFHGIRREFIIKWTDKLDIFKICADVVHDCMKCNLLKSLVETDPNLIYFVVYVVMFISAQFREKTELKLTPKLSNWGRKYIGSFD